MTILEAQESAQAAVVRIQVVGGLTGEQVADFCLPAPITVTQVKRCLWDVTAVPMYAQSLVHSGEGILRDEASVDKLPIPLEIQLICLPFATGKVPELLQAASEGDLGTVRRLARLPVDVDGACPEDGWTALILAAKNGHVEVARFLCEAGADRNKQACGGASPLSVAASNGHLEMVRLLCESGADKDLHTCGGATALWIAARNGHLQVVRLLHEFGADKNRATPGGVKPMSVAARNGHLEVVRFLCGAEGDKVLPSEAWLATEAGSCAGGA